METITLAKFSDLPKYRSIFRDSTFRDSTFRDSTFMGSETALHLLRKGDLNEIHKF